MDRMTLVEAMHLQTMEGNPLDQAQVEMFRMFVREGWSDEERIAYLRKRTLDRVGAPAAE